MSENTEKKETMTPAESPAAPDQADSAAQAAAQGENPMIRKRWFGRGIYGSKDVPIRILDAIIGLMIVAALVLTLWGAFHNGFTVSFDTGVDDLVVESQKVLHGEYVTEPEAPIRPGYVLVGWKAVDDPDVDFWDFDGFEVQGDFTLHAVWEPASFPVQFDLDGGTVDGKTEIDPITVTYGQPYGSLPTPQKEGTTFAGWTYSGQTITADTVVTMTGEHVLTAMWQ